MRSSPRSWRWPGVSRTSPSDWGGRPPCRRARGATPASGLRSSHGDGGTRWGSEGGGLSSWYTRRRFDLSSGEESCHANTDHITQTMMSREDPGAAHPSLRCTAQAIDSMADFPTACGKCAGHKSPGERLRNARKRPIFSYVAHIPDSPNDMSFCRFLLRMSAFSLELVSVSCALPRAPGPPAG